MTEPLRFRFTVHPRSWRTDPGRFLLPAGLLILALALALPGLGEFPRPWFDEGYLLQAPWNLVTTGTWGVLASDGIRAFDPGLTTGPTLLLPVAGLMALAGSADPALVRLATIPWLLLGITLWWSLTCRAGGTWVALVAVLAWLALPVYWVNPVILARQVMGEIPGMALLLLSGWAVFRALEAAPGRGVTAWWLGAGVAAGLAAITKPQFLAALPVLALAAALTWRHARGGLPAPRLLLAGLAGAVLPLATWYGLQLVLLGPAAALEAWSGTGTMATNGAAGPALAPDQLLERLLALGEGGVVPVLLAAWAVSALLARRGVLAWHPVLTWAAVTSAGWLLLYLAVFPMPWLRYALPVVILGTLPLALVLVTTARALAHRLPATAARVAVPAGLLVLLLAIALPPATTWAAWSDPGPTLIARELIARVDPDATIATTELEVTVLTPHHWIVPDTAVQVDIKNVLFLDAAPSAAMADFRAIPADYVLTGDFGERSGLFPRAELEQRGRLVIQAGSYRLYEVTRE